MVRTVCQITNKILDKYHILITYGKHNLVCNMFGKFEAET